MNLKIQYGLLALVLIATAALIPDFFELGASFLIAFMLAFLLSKGSRKVHPKE
jgi:hypothetical protein